MPRPTDEEIRKYRDTMRTVLALPGEDSFREVVMQTHEQLLTWVLEGDPTVQGALDAMVGVATAYGVLSKEKPDG